MNACPECGQEATFVGVADSQDHYVCLGGCYLTGCLFYRDVMGQLQVCAFPQRHHAEISKGSQEGPGI